MHTCTQTYIVYIITTYMSINLYNMYVCITPYLGHEHGAASGNDNRLGDPSGPGVRVGGECQPRPPQPHLSSARPMRPPHWQSGRSGTGFPGIHMYEYIYICMYICIYSFGSVCGTLAWICPCFLFSLLPCASVLSPPSLPVWSTSHKWLWSGSVHVTKFVLYLS